MWLGLAATLGVLMIGFAVEPSQINIGLKNTTKLYGVRIKDSDYVIAKSAL